MMDDEKRIEELTVWNNDILQKEGLSDWTWEFKHIDISECIVEMKIIHSYFNLDDHMDYDAKLIFLHEVAHAIVQEPVEDWHNLEFFSEYARLIQEHMGVSVEDIEAVKEPVLEPKERMSKEHCGSCFWETDEPPFCGNPDLKDIPKHHCRANNQHHWKEKSPSPEKPQAVNISTDTSRPSPEQAQTQDVEAPETYARGFGPVLGCKHCGSTSWTILGDAVQSVSLPIKPLEKPKIVGIKQLIYCSKCNIVEKLYYSALVEDDQPQVEEVKKLTSHPDNEEIIIEEMMEDTLKDADESKDSEGGPEQQAKVAHFEDAMEMIEKTLRVNFGQTDITAHFLKLIKEAFDKDLQLQDGVVGQTEEEPNPCENCYGMSPEVFNQTGRVYCEKMHHFTNVICNEYDEIVPKPQTKET